MRKLTLCVVGMLWAASPGAASPALAQMGGMGGMGGGGMGGGGHGASGPTEVDNEPSADNSIGGHDRAIEMKPIDQDKFDKVVAAMFALADVNRDGIVTLAELQSIIDARREAVIREHFRDIDINHDGKIDLDEFVTWQEDMGSAASSDCAGYAGQAQIVPETLGPPLGSSERDEALAVAIEPLSATMLTRANIHYRPGVTLQDVLDYENKRFAAADTDHDGFLERQEIDALRGSPEAHPAGAPEGRGWQHHHGGASPDEVRPGN